LDVFKHLLFLDFNKIFSETFESINKVYVMLTLQKIPTLLADYYRRIKIRRIFVFIDELTDGFIRGIYIRW